MRLLHLLQWLVSSHRPAPGLYGEPASAPPRLDPAEVRRILWVRTDAIGDAVLAMDQLRILGEAFPGAALHVVCQEHLAELYGACPFVASTLAFQRRRFRRERGYRARLLQQVRALGADLALNGVHSRETLTDALTLASRARIRCAWRGDAERAEPWKLRLAERFYTHVFDPAGLGLEIERNRSFMERLGLDAEGYLPRVWLSQEDLAFARAWFQANGLDPRRTVALFTGAQKQVRHYRHYGAALALAFRPGEVQVVALGSAEDYAANQAALDGFAGTGRNLSGAASLRQSAAVLASCRLAVGAETGLMHLAAAVGTPQAVLLGGGHFGRFAPYERGTSAACLPLDCYGCGWNCLYSRAHCVTDVPPGVLARAMREAYDGPSELPRLYCPAVPGPFPPGGPIPRQEPGLSGRVVWTRV